MILLINQNQVKMNLKAWVCCQ